MTTVTVRDTFVDAQGTPVAGKIMFEPWIAAVDATPAPGVVVTTQTVTVSLDDTGSFTVDLLSSWDDGWQVVPAGMPYKISIQVNGLKSAYSALIPPVAGQTEVVLHNLISLSEPPNVVVIPGPSGIPEAPVDGTAYARKDAGWTPAASGGGAVSSVNGETGAVVLVASEVGALPATGPSVLVNADHTKHGLQVRRTDPAASTADPEIFAVYYGPGTTDNERATWTNEKGQLRTSNIPAIGEDALKVILATGATGNALAIVKQDGTSVVRVGPNGTLIAELALRLVAGAAVGRVLVGDASGNATWQAVPVSTGASPPASPYVGQLWADPAS